VRAFRGRRAWIAAFWLVCQGVGLAAVPARFVCSHVESMLAKRTHDDHDCCKGGRLCPMHKHRKGATHDDAHHAGHHAAPPGGAATNDALPSSDRVMRAGCTTEPPTVAPILLVPGVVPTAPTVADDLNIHAAPAALAELQPTRAASPDFPPPR
jgi:hypothetical protein